MALYLFSAGVIARGVGHSSTAAAAYRAGERLTDERTGQTFDYSRRTGVLWTGIYAPKDAPEWMQDRSKLWNAVEQGEKRKDARTAREFIVAIPHELDLEQGRRLLGDFLREQFARKGFVADAAIHAPGKGGDDRNIHAHFLVTTRQVQGGRFVEKKDRTQNEKATLQQWREAWAKLGNRHLERAGHAGTLDHRNYVDQGIDRTANRHKGKAAHNMERRGIPTEMADLEKQATARQKEIAEIKAELAKLEAPPELPKPANDVGGPQDRPANDNAADRKPDPVTPILVAEAPPDRFAARPLNITPLPDRSSVSAPVPPPIERAPVVAEAPARADEKPVKVEVTPPVFGAPDAKPRPEIKARPPVVPKSKERQERKRLKEIFAAATGWAQRLFGRVRGVPERESSATAKASHAVVDRQRPHEHLPIEKSPGPMVQKQQRPAAVIHAMTQPAEKSAAAAPPRSTPGPVPYRLTTAELAAIMERRRREREQEREGPER